MRTAQLGEIATIERRVVDPGSLAPDTLYLGLEHIERGGRIIGHDTVAGAQLTSTKFTFTSDHVLFGKLRPNLGKVCRPRFAGICSTDILPIKPSQCLDRNYLAHFLSQPAMVDFAASQATGANLPRLSPTQLAKFELPLPPLDEQRRIAAILDHVDKLRTKRQRLDPLVERSIQSLFHEVVDGIPVEPLGPNLKFVTSGGRGWAKYYAPEGDPFIRSLDVQMNHVSADDLAFVEAPDNAEARRTRTQLGDVLLTITGSRIGRAAALPNAFAGAFVSQHVAIIRPDPNRLLPEFLANFLCAPALGQHQILNAQYGQTKPGLNFQQIREFSIPMPGLSQQQQFLERLRRVRRFQSNGEFMQSRLDELFTSLQSRAFRGEL